MVFFFLLYNTLSYCEKSSNHDWLFHRGKLIDKVIVLHYFKLLVILRNKIQKLVLVGFETELSQNCSIFSHALFIDLRTVPEPKYDAFLLLRVKYVWNILLCIIFHFFFRKRLVQPASGIPTDIFSPYMYI